MDVRGPKRAAARRLIQGTVLVCAAAAAAAPTAVASTVTNEHDVSVTAPDQPVTYTGDPAAANSLKLTVEGGQLVFADATASVVQPQSDPNNPAVLVNDCGAATLDTVTCPPGPTKITLGAGDDTLELGDGLPALTIDGQAGVDKLDFAQRGDNVAVRLDGNRAGGMTVDGVESVTGGTADDLITGDAHVNQLFGGGGDDMLRGGDGRDTIAGQAGDDVIVAADGFVDTITCGDGTDTVTADLGANGVSDIITDPQACESVTGSVAAMTSETTLTPVIVVPARPGLVPVLAPGKADFADLTPPKAAMRSFTRQRLATVLKRGVPIRVTCQEACGISIALSLDRTTARRLKLDARTSPVVVGTASAVRNLAGSSRLHVKFTKKARAALKRSRRNVVATAQVLVSDASGNGMLLTRRVTLVR
jgi:hypothetical protein